MSGADEARFVEIMRPVGEMVLGELGYQINKQASKPGELRFGSKGSLSIDLAKGQWFDHEDNEGGGVIKFLKAFRGYDKPDAVKWLIDNGFLDDRPRDDGTAQDSQKKFIENEPVAIYDYHDPSGRLAYQVLKYAKGVEPRFRQRRPHPEGKGWIWALSGGKFGRTFKGDWFRWKDGSKYEETAEFPEQERYLYRQNDIAEAIAEGREVLLVEGEKDADSGWALGIPSTTQTGGANKWLPQYTSALKGARIVAIPDNDKAGRNNIARLGYELRGAVESMRVLDLRCDWQDMPEKADLTDWKERGGTTETLLNLIQTKAQPWRPAPPDSKFNAILWSDLEKKGQSLDYVIDEWFTERGRSLIAGPSGSGKSFLAIHAAMCVARGVDFLEQKVHQGAVVYQAGEGGYGIKNRFLAYKRHFQVPDSEFVPIVPMAAKINLFAKDGHTQPFIDEIRAWQDYIGMRLAMVFIDTLAQASIGADENNGKDMGYVLDNIGHIEDALGCNVCLVHHMNADGKKVRGHTSIHANVDQVVLVTKDEETNVKTALLAKQKDGADNLKKTFELMPVEVGFNERFEREVTSCVVLPVGEKEQLRKEQERQGVPITPTGRHIMTVLFKALDKYGVFIASAADGPQEAVGKAVVDFAYYLEEACNMDVVAEDKAKAKDAARKTFWNHSKKLMEMGVISSVRYRQPGAEKERAYVWWTGKPVRGFGRTFKKENLENSGNIPGKFPEISDSELDEFLGETSGELPF